MRLIDADKVIYSDVSCTDGNTYMVVHASMIDKQKTAYDVDKIVEQLEERVSFLEDCSKHEHQTEEQRAKSYSTMMMYEVADLVNDLIEIVKRGGIDER